MNHPVADSLLHAALPFADYRHHQQTRLDSAAEARAQQAGARVGISQAHESAALHVTGSAAYIDDLPELAGTLHCALGLSPVAAGRLLEMALDAVQAMPGVVRVLTAADIPGVNDCGSAVKDEPILCDGEIRFLGQPVFAVVAETREQARRAAALAGKVLRIDAAEPVLTPRQAHAQGRYVVPPMHLVRSASGLDEAGIQAAIGAAPHRLSGSLDVGGQEQFYLEGQISYAIPKEGHGMHLHCSTQHPSEMQHLVAHALGVHAHAVLVECRRMGGGFGGKESQSAQFACIAAVAARLLQRPVKLRLDRDDDFMVTGRRHGFWYEYDIGYDDEGRILGATLQMVSHAGHSADLSAPVMTRAICHFDNAYWLPEVAMHGYCGKTHTQSNTAFRGFGGPQGAIAVEYILDSIARRLGRDPLAVRRANFYGRGERNVTPYGQTVRDNIIHELVDQLEASSDYGGRRAAIAAFNADSPVLKRGIALTPLKFGISFNVKHFNQAGALVHVYTDGTVQVNHGGTEMGQGLNTKVAQIVADELGVPLSQVQVTASDTSKVPNASATAASSGTDLNGRAAQYAAGKVRSNLAAFVAGLANCGAGAITFSGGLIHSPSGSRPFNTVVKEAYANRIQLWSDGFYRTPKIHYDKATLTGRPFYYFAYGLACTEVAIDTLTGESKVLAIDVLYDAGRSINPAIDIGQVEGGFIQGMGWLTTEQLVWNDQGLLTTHAPSTYKIPATGDIPEHFKVELLEEPNHEDNVGGSKAVGEPPFMLAISVYEALRHAIGSHHAKRGQAHTPVQLQAPATAEHVLKALQSLPN